MEIKLKVVEPVLVAALRHVGPYSECGPTFGRLYELLGAAGLCSADTVAYGVYYDDPEVVPAETCRMDVCAALPQGVDATTPALAQLLQSTDLLIQHLGNGGEYASILVKGSYSLLPSAWRHLFEWLPSSDREPDHSMGFEAYYNDPCDTPPEELLTEIFLPLKAAQTSA